MSDNRLLKLLYSSPSFAILKEFIEVSLKLEVYLMDREGRKIDAGSNEQPDAIADMTDRTARVLECPRTGCQQLIVPVAARGRNIGILLCRESKFTRLRGSQYRTALLFLTDYMIHLMKEEVETAGPLLDKELTHQQAVVKDVLAYIHQNYHTASLSLREICQRQGISYHYLSHLFKEVININFSSYLTNFRIKKAMKLLANKSLAVSQIAYQCGFEDPGYFSKSFRSATGSSPSDYRNRAVLAASRKRRKRKNFPLIDKLVH